MQAVAGSADKHGCNDGLASQALFHHIFGVSQDPKGRFVVADTGKLRLVESKSGSPACSRLALLQLVAVVQD